jgi:LPXTG-motif cell wall-anchored protein
MLRHELTLAFLAAVHLLVPAARATSAEPQAAFALSKGWVELGLKLDGRPVADAVIEVTDERGANFGTGETGADGQAVFPMPPGATFVVEIKSGGRSADPIRLYRNGDAIEPSRVLLSYGLRPCCRFKSRGDDAGPTEAIPSSPQTQAGMPWLPLTGAAALVGAALWIAMRRRPGVDHG